jgi:hypothetical protein
MHLALLVALTSPHYFISISASVCLAVVWVAFVVGLNRTLVFISVTRHVWKQIVAFTGAATCEVVFAPLKNVSD